MHAADPRELRIVMLGTKDFARPTLAALLDGGLKVVALFTQPDRPQGRKREIIPAAVKVLAQERGVPVEQPEDVNAPEGVALVAAYAPDLLVTVAYGQILSAELLGVPRLGGINLHGSILPAYRGAAPVARAIQRGEAETGVTVIRMSPRVDAGGTLLVARTPIGSDETAGELEARLAELGAPLVIEAIAALAEGRAEAIAQDRSLVTKAPKLSKEEGEIDWSRPAQDIHNLVRAMQPWPQARTTWRARGTTGEPIVLIVHATTVEPAATAAGAAPGTVIEAAGDRLVVASGDGRAVRLKTIQVVGRRALPTADFLRGCRVGAGDVLGVR